MADIRINKKKLSSIAVERMMNKIRTGEWTQGTQLPSERKLSDELGVSRTVIREALQTLKEMGILDVQNGINIIHPITFDGVLSQIMQQFMPSKKTTAELMEVRMLLEDYCVKKAVASADEPAISRMQKAINLMQSMLEKGKIGYEYETAFHTELLRAANNGVLSSIYSICGDMMNSSARASLMAAASSGKEITAVKEHQGILDAICARDESLARERMNKHLSMARDNLIASQEDDC